MWDIRYTHKKKKVYQSPEDLFDIAISEAQKANVYRKKTQTAVKWYLQLIRRLSPGAIDRSSFTKRRRNRQQVEFGKMYCYVYDAKTKDDLPYWDKFPLIFPISPNASGTGWYGLNVHYVPLDLRARLLYNLYKLINNNKFDETTKLKLSYKYLTELSSFDKALSMVAFKQYLASQVRSRFIYIEPDEWPMALYLPMENWQKLRPGAVYQDIEQEIRKLRNK